MQLKVSKAENSEGCCLSNRSLIYLVVILSCLPLLKRHTTHKSWGWSELFVCTCFLSVAREMGWCEASNLSHPGDGFALMSPPHFSSGDSSMLGSSSLPPWSIPLGPRNWLWPQRRMWLQRWILALERSVSELTEVCNLRLVFFFVFSSLTIFQCVDLCCWSL